MCLSGIYLLAGNVSRREKTVSSHAEKGAADAGKPSPSQVLTPTVQVTIRQLEQLSPSTPRVQMHHAVWSSMKLISRRVAQNFRALVHTGRLRNTVTENFKTLLNKNFSTRNTLEWKCEFYKSCNSLLDIGCDPAVVMGEFVNKLPRENYEILAECFNDEIMELSKKEVKTLIAKELLQNAFSEYCLSCLKGEILNSHSILKHIENLVTHLQRDGIDVLEVTHGIWDKIKDIAGREISRCSTSYVLQTGQRKKYQNAQLKKFNGMQDKVRSLVTSMQGRER